MYAVFVNDGFDSVFEYKQAAKDYAASCRENGCRAHIKKLTKAEIEFMNL